MDRRNGKGGGWHQASNEQGGEPLGIELPVLGGGGSRPPCSGRPHIIANTTEDMGQPVWQELLPSRLGAAEPTWRDLVEVASRGKSSSK